MDFFKKYTTPFGYVADGNQVDAYGVDHSNFSTRDEVEYQFARQEREKQMADNLKQQGIEPENYPQLGNSFWGNNPENSYGFGTSNISTNVENRENQFTNFSLFQKSMANDDMSYKLAQNTSTNTASDVNALRQQTIQNVSKGITVDEGISHNVYLDTMCKKTIGKGKNVNNWDIFRQVNFIKPNGTPANEAEKLDCFNKFEQRTHNLCDGKPVVDGKKINYKDSYFVDVCDLKISPQEIERLKNEHIRDDLKRLERHVDNLYSYPSTMVNEIENRLYNVGWGNFKKLDIIPILNDSQLTLEEKKKLLEKRLYQGKISPKRLQDSRKRLLGN